MCPNAQDARLDLSQLREMVQEQAELIEILSNFQAYTRAQIAGLKQALATGDLASVLQAAHRIKGDGRMIGALEFAGVCEAIENAARQNNLEGARTGAAALDKAYQQLDSAIRKVARTGVQRKSNGS